MTKLDPRAWINARVKESDFQKFIGGTSPETALMRCLAKCTTEEGAIDAGAFETLKTNYLEYCRVSWNLPASVVAGL